jgi:2-methylcitrate dehydratase PrpD
MSGKGNPMELTTVQKVAHRVCELRPEDIPAAAIDQAVWCVLDLLGAALAGFGQASARSVRAFARGFCPPGSSGIWFTAESLSPAGAAFCNAAAGSALDLDDGHRAAGGHPGAALIPSLLAVAQPLNAPGRDVLAALVVGYEVAVRAAAARHPATLDTFSTGRWCGFGAAAVQCWLEGRGPEILSQALAISGIHAPLQSASAYSRIGHHVKEGIPWATFTGLAAVDLAAQGFIGPLDIWDHPAYYDGRRILDGFGRDWAILGTYFKPYACCRWLHAALDAWQAIAGQGIDHREVERIEVFTFQRAVDLPNAPDPASLEQAQFSLPFCLAVAALEGPGALLPLPVDLLGQPRLASFARKVNLQLDLALEAEFPAQAGARLAVHTTKGVFSGQVDHPRGDPVHPLSVEELTSKFFILAGHLLEHEAAERILRAVLNLRHGRLDGLASVLTDLKRDTIP